MMNVVKALNKLIPLFFFPPTELHGHLTCNLALWDLLPELSNYSAGTGPYVDLCLMCLQEDMSMSFCSAILICVLTLWKWKSLSRVRLFATPLTVQSMEFSMPKCWSGQPFPSPGDLPNPGIEPRSPTLHTDSLPAEPPGKPKSTGVGSLSLLQQIFLTQQSNQGLLHFKQILYQLSYQGSLCFFIY